MAEVEQWWWAAQFLTGKTGTGQEKNFAVTGRKGQEKVESAARYKDADSADC